MGFFTQKTDEDPTKPLGEATPDAPSVKEDVAPGVEKTESDYNCTLCGGEGLVWNELAQRHEKCLGCQGTGKVN